MAGEAEDDVPESGAVFTFGKSKFADNVPSKFWLKNDVPSKISCGDEHTALITENGKLFMFGSNNWGQLGLGSKATVNKPTCVKALKSERVHLVACGRNHTLICTAQGKVLASGGNSEGQLGLGDCEERTSFQTVPAFDSHGPIKMLAAGSNTSAALTASGKLFMWGDNTEGQIGLGKESHASSPQEVSVGRPISWVSCGYYHSAFVTADGALYTFGERDSGKLGLGTEQLPRHRVPQRVKSIKQPVVQVACGGGHTVALTEDDLLTFGLGQFGQLGHGTFTFESRLPRPVEHFRRGRVHQVTCGENHTAVVTDGGVLYTFGDGRHGKLGLGDENFTNQFKPTLCSRFLRYDVQAVTCGGCHMVVLARPRDLSRGGVTLEADDVTEDFLEKPYVELLGDTADSSALQRSLSARVRRRERERSPDQFGAMFRTLPAMTPGYLRPPPPVSSQTVPPRLPPPELTHRKVLNGTHQHGSAGSNHQGQTGGEADGAVESLSDSDSVKGLGETTDFLNMTHVMKMDPRDKTLSLSPVQKRKGKHGKTNERHKDDQERERKLWKQSGFSSTSQSQKKKIQTASPRQALPTELLIGHSARSLASQRPKTTNQNKENLILAVEELQRKPSKNTPPSVGDIRKAATGRRFGPVQGKSQLIDVGRKLSDKQSPETRKTGSGVGSESTAAKVKQVQPKAVSVKSKAPVGQTAGRRSTGSPGFHLSDASNDESSGRPRLPAEGKTNSRSKDAEFSKKSKDERNKKEAQSKKHVKENEKEASDLSLLAGAASLAAGSALIHEAASRSRFSSPSPSPSESSRGVLKRSATKQRDAESESYAADFSNKSAVSINIVPAPESPDKETSQETSQGEKETSQETSQGEGEEEQRTSADVSEEEEEEEEDVSHSIKKITEEEEDDDKDSDTLQPAEDSEMDEEEEGSRDEEEEEEEEASGTAGSQSEDETEGKESKGSDVEEEEEEEGESEEGSSHETESKGGESENEEEGEEEEGDLESEGEEEEGESDVESEAEEGEEEEEKEQSSAEEEEEESSEEEERGDEEESEEEDEEGEEEEGEESENEEQEEEDEAEEESAEEEAEEEKESEEEVTEEDEEDEEAEEEEAEEEEEEEEEVVKKRKSAEVKRQSAENRSQLRSGVKGQAAGESEEFWDDVLPQYLNLK
ncbi:retinitis pigmentosa GTPase regulator b isoform X2 [Chaetodon auriga]|uniref:retinitis pigmentosa GTPase regulator b isoform X2 n=1 Tax=Chaetodon auriga TaxID=39042 RepID=UPI004032BA44